MIATARADLKALLDNNLSGVNVYAFPPERLEAPAVIIDTAPLIEPAETYGALEIRFKLTAVVAPAADMGIQVAALDNLVSKLVETLRNAQTEVRTDGHVVLVMPDSQQLLAYELNAITEY